VAALKGALAKLQQTLAELQKDRPARK
jgi:hypothetical protein